LGYTNILGWGPVPKKEMPEEEVEEGWVLDLGKLMMEDAVNEVVKPVGGFLLLYVVARKLDAVPPLLVPYLDSLAGVLVLVTIPLLVRYIWLLPGLRAIIEEIAGFISEFWTALRGSPQTPSDEPAAPAELEQATLRSPPQEAGAQGGGAGARRRRRAGRKRKAEIKEGGGEG